MRRVSIAFALSTLFVSVASAQPTATTFQQTATSAGNQANTAKVGGDPDTVTNCAGAQNGRIAIFKGSAPPNITICNSGIYEAKPYGTGAIGILNPNPIAALDVNGDINTSLYYQIGGSNVLSVGSPDDGNLFLGVGAGASNVSGQGTSNTFSGNEAGLSNTTGGANTFSGMVAGYSNSSGSNNTFTGACAGCNNTTGSNNTFTGWLAGHSNTTGQGNTFYGEEAGLWHTMGDADTFIGSAAGSNNDTGSDNTFTGTNAGTFDAGSSNTFYGFSAGTNNYYGNNNIYVGNPGCPLICAESSTIRIGGDNGAGYGPQTAAYIAGIYGVNVGGIPVQINANGQLGAQTSSLRFKEQVRDMGDSSSSLMKLRPVTFLYKPEYDKGERTLQYGLIAEEVAKVYPELVAYDNDGQPYTARYQYITTMLLNEVQKQYHRFEGQAEVIKAQQQEIQSLKQQLQVENVTLQERLSRLEALVRVEVATAK